MKISRWTVFESALCLLAIGMLIFDATMDGNASRFLWKLASQTITKLTEAWRSSLNLVR